MKQATAMAPRTVGNVAAGFDMLGHALEGLGDEVTAIRTDSGVVRVLSIDGADTPLPTDADRNTAGRAVQHLLTFCPRGTGFDLRIRKGIAMGSGMGGSAASAAAAVVAAAATLDEAPTMDTLYAAAVAGEGAATGAGHGDNVAPALLGGLVIAPSAGAPLQVPVPAWLHAAVVRPHFPLETRRSREVLQAPYPLHDFVRQSEALALLLMGCMHADASCIRRGLRDVLVEPRRAPLIPGFATVKAAAMQAEALGASISGGGPSVFAWFESRSRAERGAAAMQSAFRAAGHESESVVSAVNAPGARILP